LNQLVYTTLCGFLLCAVSCAKKEPKPLRTEPWLAHPTAEASASGDAAPPLTRYRFGDRSSIRFEIPSKRGSLRGTISRVSGELEVDLSDLTRSRGLVRAELDSLAIRAPTGSTDAALLERARVALELTADAGVPAFTSFDLTSVEDAIPAQIEPPQAHEAEAAFVRRARVTAVGNLLLHGFRVARRAPLEVEFGFSADGPSPSSVAIRSRAPLVVSLETHAIRALDHESSSKSRSAAPILAREVRVSVELYGTKVD